MTWLSPKHIVQAPRGCEGGSDLHSGQLAAAARKSEETVEELFLGHDAALCGSCGLTLAGRIHDC